MPLGRLVPWLSWDEWHNVRTGLFSADITRLNRALDQVCLRHTTCRAISPMLAYQDRLSAASSQGTSLHMSEGLMTAQVSAWEARGKLPLGADMTAAIQRMRLRDTVLTGAALPLAGQPSLQGQSVSAEQESMLRMQYALAIIRLVNGISDSAQKGTVAKSVAHLAESAGMCGAVSQHCCSLGSVSL